MLEESPTCMWGQDIGGDKGGVFKVTRGLAFRYPDRVNNAPINEPLIMGTAIGAAHHPELRAVPEIQFGDYSLNTLHWLVHGGNLYWGSGGNLSPNITLRTPVDPVQGGAIYHSMNTPPWVSSRSNTSLRLSTEAKRSSKLVLVSINMFIILPASAQHTGI